MIARLRREFPKIKEERILLHIAVNFLEYQILSQVFNKVTFNRIIERESTLKGIKEAWVVVLSNKKKLVGILKV